MEPRFVLDQESGLDVSFAWGDPSVTHHVCNTGEAGGHCTLTAWVDGYEVGTQQVYAEAGAYAMFSFELGALYPGPHRLDIACAPPDDGGVHAMATEFTVPDPA